LGLGVAVFELEGEQYALLSFELPRSKLPARLTPAERGVALLVLEGMANAEIARARNTSTHTVANQLRRIYEKLGVAGRTELVQRCCPTTEP
jgi:DNA-binding CsgD family transcriptional regulator